MKKISLAKQVLAVLLTLSLLLSFVACAAQQPVPAESSAESLAASSAGESSAVSSEPAAGPVALTVMAAASLTDVMAEVAKAYQAVAPNVTVTYSFGASGALQTQIEEGAPADIFFSAAQKQMDALAEKDLIVSASRKDLLINKVVLIVPKNSKTPALKFEDTVTDAVAKIGLGDPASVPVGQYAEEVFTSLNILDGVKAKAVYGSDVRTVLTWVESGEVDCGVVYATDAAVSTGVTVATEAPEGSHKKVVYPAAVLKASKNLEAAQAFLDYLSTPEAGALFEKYGFALS